MYGTYPYKGFKNRRDISRYLQEVAEGKLHKPVSNDKTPQMHSNEMRDLTNQLLEYEETNRLGYAFTTDKSRISLIHAGIVGAGDIKLHPWFQCIDWNIVQGGDEAEIEKMCQGPSNVMLNGWRTDSCCNRSIFKK